MQIRIDAAKKIRKLRSRSSASASRPRASRKPPPLAAFLRRRRRQREAEHAEHERRDGRHREGIAQESCGQPGLRVPREQIADREPGDDPADGAPHADIAEVPRRVVHLPERDRVDERERRHVQDHVEQQIRIERGKLRRAREQVHQRSADQMDHAEQPLGVHVLVRDEPDDERRDDGAPRLSGIGQRAVGAAEAERARQIAAHRDEPGAPDEELEKHHDTQAQPDSAVHNLAPGRDASIVMGLARECVRAFSDPPSSPRSRRRRASSCGSCARG